MARPKKTDVGEKYSSAFAENLRNLYKDHGMTRDDLAKYLEKSPQAISGYLNGDTVPNAEILVSISKLFHVSCDYLLGIVDVMEPDPSKQLVSKVTGISEAAAAQTMINRYSEGGEVLNAFLETSETYALLHEIYQYQQILKSEYQEVNEEIKQAAHILNSAGYFYVTPQYAAELHKQQIVQNFALLLDTISERKK